MCRRSEGDGRGEDRSVRATGCRFLLTPLLVLGYEMGISVSHAERFFFQYCPGRQSGSWTFLTLGMAIQRMAARFS